jgi:hypothetical protein
MCLAVHTKGCLWGASSIVTVSLGLHSETVWRGRIVRDILCESGNYLP